MKKIKEGLFPQRCGKKIGLALGVLVILAFILPPCMAVLSPNFTAKTQSDRPLDSPGISLYGNNLAYGDFLFVHDTTWSPGSNGEIITSRTWNLSNVSNLNEFYLQYGANAVFGPFVKGGESYQLNLTVKASDSSEYSTGNLLYSITDDRRNISANLSALPAYDNQTAQNPNGTITFWDRSTFASFMDSSNGWWWNLTDLTTGRSMSASGQDHVTADMSDTEFMVNLTVKNVSGNYSSITRYIRIPPDNVIPRANFSVVPKYGTAPLEIAIIDQAQSMVNYTVSNVPLVYNYTIWKNGVKLFQNTTKNVNVTLSDPGVYQIIQNVTNSFGRSNEFTVGDIVVNLPDKPIVNFSATVREGLAPLNVTLIDQTIGSKPFTYEWVIGNDTWRSQSKSDDNPQFNLTYSGNYWVNLTVTDKNGRFDSLNKTNFITVGPQKYPIAAFTAIPMSGPYPLNVSFIDQSVLNPDLFSSEGKDAVFKWDFGDGTNSTLKNPTHLYTQAGEYTVRLWIAHGGNMIASKPAMINVTEESDYPDLTLNASFTAVPDHGNPPLTVSFVDTSRKNEPVTYDWDFGDGSMHETAPNAIHTFTASSTVTLTITGAKSGRTSSYSHLVVVEDLDTNFIATVSGKTVSFMDYSTGFPTQWYWTFGDGYSSREQNPVHTYAASGTYSVTLSSWNELRKSVKSMVIEVP